MEVFSVSFRDFKPLVLELEVCKNCIQAYGGRGAWPPSFGLTVLLHPQKLFSPYVPKKYFLNSEIFRVEIWGQLQEGL